MLRERRTDRESDSGLGLFTTLGVTDEGTNGSLVTPFEANLYDSLHRLNLVEDGAFEGAAEPPAMPGYEVYGAGETIGQWVVEQGYVILTA